ncbi:MMPL family transporter [Parvibaculaceae bacterium PLY_AMNH_Bact1]|nr:MMPL family transporter [Parvibaculaceae bacterium PLY_AMNH_Bact1]
MVKAFEEFIFRFRFAILVIMAIFTIATGYFATGLKLEAGFLKQVPTEHPYLQTYFEYQQDMPGANLVLVALKAKEGTIWNREILQRLHKITEEVSFLPGVDRSRLYSLWYPTTRALTIDEFGFQMEDLIPGTLTPERLTDEDIADIRERTIASSWIGGIVSEDETAALVVFEIKAPGGASGDIESAQSTALDVASLLESKIRAPFSDEVSDVAIIGFPKFIGDIAEGAIVATSFFLLAFVITGVAVFAYVRSFILTALAIGCSLVSVVWQLGVLNLIGMGLDPLAILVPFLVYAIGVSHGMQQVNLIATQIAKGSDGLNAARQTFRRLLVPGSMALITDLVGFITLYLIPVGVVRDIAIIATIGVGLKIISNLIMLPLLASYFRRDEKQVRLFIKARVFRERVMTWIAGVAKPSVAPLIAGGLVVVLVGSAIGAQYRHVGDLTPAASELRPDAKYNQDTAFITQHFDIGTDVLVLVLETPPDACINPGYMKYLDAMTRDLSSIDGVLKVDSLASTARFASSVSALGNLKWRNLPSTERQLISATAQVDPALGLLNDACTILPLFIYTVDHKAETIDRLIEEITAYAEEHPLDGVNARIGLGGVSVIAATNQVVEASEAPLLIYVFLTIIILVLIAYVDWRAIICCCVPLLLATSLGYVFMVVFGIGLKVTTLPVLVLATGIGVDYAFYLYSQIRIFQREGFPIADAYHGALLSTGMAVVYASIMLAGGVGTWIFSPLQFQADMGALLSFMFIANMICAIVGLPALAALLERIAPPKHLRTA